ncbi:preprotein translocase subunit YajC [Acrocarpospora catenulata]|uniref:preprotein translocase subunit YajC n=1 Tax=Acrocarpospora catenulata TaxID=2836182 RepID=UPI001BDAAC3E|nr:preprotein translocase subunit YajC [Acrocarpospora catenulata]
MNGLGQFLPIILLIVVFYFLLIRPQRKRQQEQIAMQNSLAVGSRVMTTTGLFATVVGFADDDVLLEVAPGVETRWAKAAIGRVITPVDDADDAAEDPGDEADDAEDATADAPEKGDSSTKKS